MELTLKNLILFLEREYPYGDNFYSETKLRDESRNCVFDGIDSVDLLEHIAKEFNVTFENFDFHEYFLDESELSNLTWKALFKKEKQREIKAELTIQMLFDYMSKNTKNTI